MCRSRSHEDNSGPASSLPAAGDLDPVGIQALTLGLQPKKPVGAGLKPSPLTDCLYFLRRHRGDDSEGSGGRFLILTPRLARVE